MMLTIAIIDSNEAYRRLQADKLLGDHADKIDIDTFSSIENYKSQPSKRKYNVFLVDSELAAEAIEELGDANIIFLVDDRQIESLHGHSVIFRYQSSKLIYKSILNICSEQDDGATWKSEAIGDVDIITFFPTGGGAGASTLAAATALAAAHRGKRVFYLNLELFGKASTYFTAPGSGGLDEVLYAIVAKKSNVTMRIQGATRQTSEGLNYLESCTHSLDIAELSPERFEQIVREIVTSAEYDILIFDLDFAHSPLAFKAMSLSSEVVFVSDGTLTANKKFEQIRDYLSACVAKGTLSGMSNVVLAYNNFSSQGAKRLKDSVVPVIGGAPRFVSQDNDIRSILASLSNAQVVTDILLRAEEV